ncbi:ferrochelatase [Candidatus Levibacter sp. Uisw_134_01]|uniref:ferrochelatase n=1 Tax=Candidatus Levibacter sp. Uisw_134_01 TaxID=3230999 RepID=UPI003D537CEB
MAIIKKPSDHPYFPLKPKIGVLLVNLGTPDGTDYWSMRKYLKQFLMDRRVVDIFKPLWWLILNGPILTFRPSKSGKAYQKIWDKDNYGSPLRKHTINQTKKLQELFKQDKQIIIEHAMRYGKPEIDKTLYKMKENGCTKIVLMPLYPQYAASTSATVKDEVFKWLLVQRWQPDIRTIPPWFDDSNYIKALANTIKDNLKNKIKPDMLLISFHGIPKRYFMAGDPYHCHCIKTARLLREELKWPEDEILVTFQSRFGPEPWLQPYTDKTIIDLAKNGIKNIAVVAPGFISDCLETLEELNVEARELFIENGGQNFEYIPCLNDNKHSIKLLNQIIKTNLLGWVE